MRSAVAKFDLRKRRSPTPLPEWGFAFLGQRAEGSIQAPFDVDNALVDQLRVHLRRHLLANDPLGCSNSGIDSRGPDLVERLGLGPSDLLLSQLGAPREAFFQALTRLGGEGLRFTLRLLDDGVGLVLSLATLALIVVEELLGFLAQAPSFVQLTADRIGALIERLRDQAGNLVVDEQADEQTNAAATQNSAVLKIEPVLASITSMVPYSPGTGSRARRASSALTWAPISFSTMEPAVSVAMSLT